jgi:hypothetical protein
MHAERPMTAKHNCAGRVGRSIGPKFRPLPAALGIVPILGFLRTDSATLQNPKNDAQYVAEALTVARQSG